MRIKRSILTAGLIMLVAAVIVSCTTKTVTEESTEIKLVSFNVRYNAWGDIDGENRWTNRRDAVVRMVEQERPAAMGLQEALLDQLQFLDSCLPQYRRIGVGRDDGKEQGEFMAIYYDTAQLELLDGDTRWLSPTPDVPSRYEGAGCMRTVTIARFCDRNNGKEFAYLNTHLDHISDAARAYGAQVIASVIAERFDGVPVVVGGDMNCTADYGHNMPFNTFYHAGLRDARSLTDSTSHAITYNAFGQNEGAVIDHFLVRDMEVLTFRTLDGDYGVPYISDHYPIELRVKI